MTESIENLLKDRNYSEPEEIAIIREYVFKKYGRVPGMKISDKKIIIQVPSASLAGTLRLELHHLEKKIKNKHKLIIQIRR